MLLEGPDWQALLTSLMLAGITSVLVVCIGLLVVICRDNLPTWLRQPLDALLLLPMMLPPTVLGFYLLVLLAPHSYLGKIWHAFTGQNFAFEFLGLVVGSVIYSLPFVMPPLLLSHHAIAPSVMESATLLGANRLQRIVRVWWPFMRRGALLSGILGFAHTLGEFGIVLMIGGSIPGETLVASIAIFQHLEAGNYGAAHQLAAVLISIAMLLIIAVLVLNPTLSGKNHRFASSNFD